MLETFVQHMMTLGLNKVQLPAQQMDPRQQLLAQMADVISPEGVSWWPLAIGWWALLILAIVLVSVTALWIIQRYKKQYYRKQAKRLVEGIYTHKEMTTQQRAVQMMLALKRIFFTAYPEKRKNHAGIYGSDWFDFLTASLTKSYKVIPDTESFKNELNDALYKDKAQNSEHTLDQLYRFSLHWIEKHPKSSANIEGDINSPSEVSHV